MATTTMTTAEREKLLDRYVELFALETFFIQFMQPSRPGRTVFEILSGAGFVQPREDTWPGTLDELIQQLADLHGRLWPDEIIPGRTDYEPVETRSDVAAARLFVNAAGRPDTFAAEADALIAKASR